MISKNSFNHLKFFVTSCLVIFLSKFLIDWIIKFPIHVSVYQAQCIGYQILKQPTWLTAFAITLLLCAYGIYKKIEFTNVDKLLLFTCNVVLLLTTVFIEPNYFFNQAYTFDRVLIFIIFLLAFKYPILSLFYILYALLFIKQLQVPALSSFTFTDKSIFYQISVLVVLNAIANYFIVDTSRKRTILIASWVLFSMWYLLAAYAKIIIGWWDNQLVNLFTASTLYDWLIDFPSVKNFIFGIFKKSNDLLIVLTLLVEIAVVFFFWNKKMAIGILISLFFLHLIIFVSTGIFFWKWLVLVVVLFLFLIRNKNDAFFSRQAFVFSALLYVFLFFAFPSATKLGWFDMHLVTLHKIYAVDEQGNETKLDASYFAPYDVVFAQNRFQKIVNKNTICDIYGSLNNEKLARGLYTITNSNEIKRFVDINGINKFDSTDYYTMRNFIVRFVKNKSYATNYLPISSPMHIWQGNNQKKVYLNPSRIVVKYFEINTARYPSVDTIYINQWIVNI